MTDKKIITEDQASEAYEVVSKEEQVVLAEQYNASENGTIVEADEVLSDGFSFVK